MAHPLRRSQGGGTNVEVAKLQMFDAAYKLASSPDDLPDKVFAAIGVPSIHHPWVILVRVQCVMRFIFALTTSFLSVFVCCAGFQNNHITPAKSHFRYRTISVA